MAGIAGRGMLFKVGDGGDPSETFTTFGGIQSVSASHSNGTVDITNNDDSGVRELLEGKFGMASSFSMSGVTKDEAAYDSLFTDFQAGTKRNFQIVIPGANAGGTLDFAGIITGFEESGGTDDPLGFSLTIESSGAVTKS